MESITVNYTRKVSPGNFESVGIGGSIEFKPTSEDLQAEYDRGLMALKLIIDAKVAEVVGRSGGTFDEPVEADLGEQPAWVGQNPERIDALLGRGQMPTPPPPPPIGPSAIKDNAKADQEVDDGLPEIPSQHGASNPSTPAPTGNPNGREVYLEKAKVFRSEMKRSSKTSRVYAELRVGHNDLVAHINEQYVTVRVFDPAYIAAVGSLTRMKNEETGQVEDVQKLLVGEKDFVNLWGAFSAWQSDSNKFDINATAVQKVE